MQTEFWLDDKQFNCAECISCFENGDNYCKNCGFDMNRWNEPDTPPPPLPETRKCIVAKYYVEDYFIIPEDVDLEDKTKVSWYDVKYNTLTIALVNGEFIEIQSVGYCDNYDYKRPQETYIDDIDTHCLT